MNINSGDLSQRIAIYENNQISDGYGGTIPNDTVYWSTFAKVIQLGSSRTQEANQSPMKQVFNFTIRYRNDKQIQNDMLLKWRNQYYIIQGYVPDVIFQKYVRFDAVVRNAGVIVNEGTT
jgi:SPP1 family predicted phage head-tail adaptor